MKRCCKSCGAEYAHEVSANFMAFCPECGVLDHMECEYGYGAVVPCKIYYKNMEIGTVTSDGDNRYRLDSDYFELHKNLEHTHMDALKEAGEIVSALIKER